VGFAFERDTFYEAAYLTRILLLMIVIGKNRPGRDKRTRIAGGQKV
jgi:hypothetical protein